MKTIPHFKFHPEGHYRGKERKEFKKLQKKIEAVNDALYFLERAKLGVEVKSKRNGDLIIRVSKI